MFYNVFILEDDLIQASFLTQTIQNFSPELHAFHAGTLDTALQLIQSDLNFHAFFLDIALDSPDIAHDALKIYADQKNEEGLQVARLLQTSPRYQNTPVIFLTGHSEYITRALNRHHCFAFLQKPYTAGDVYQQLADIFQEKKSSLIVKDTDGIYTELAFDQILYIRSEGRYLTFNTPDDSFVSRQYTLKKLLPLLPPVFFRCHRSYIVNQSFIQRYDFPNHTVYIKPTGEKIPLRRDITHLPTQR